MPDVTKQYYNPNALNIGVLRSTAFGTKRGVDGIGTATVPTSVIYKTILADTGSFALNGDLVIDKMDLTSLNDIFFQDTREFIESYSSRPIISWTGPLQHKVFANLLAAAFQNVAEGALTPFQKTYTFPSTPINFAGGSGYVYNIAARFPYMGGANYGCRMRSAIVDSLIITIECDSRGFVQVVKYSVTWIGLEPERNLNFATASQEITFATEDKTWLAGRKATLMITNETDLDAFTTPFKSFSFTINTNSVPIGTTSSGYTDSYIIAPTASASLLIPYTQEMTLWFDDIQAGDIFSFNATINTFTAENGFMIYAVGRIKNDLPTGSADKILTIPLEMDCFDKAATPTQIVLTDAIDWAF